MVKKGVKKKVIPKKNSTDRVKTGIPNFDALIEGGFEKNSTNLIIGNSGSGKSIFGLQFLIGGMEKGEKCLYVTFEEKKAQFYTNMKKFGWDLEKYEKQGLFTFLEYTPTKVKGMLEEGGGTIESIILTKKVSRMVIDSITSFELLFEDELTKREAAMALFALIKGWNCTSMLTYEEEFAQKEKASSHTLEFESDAIIALYSLSEKGERNRYLEIIKMRGTAHSKKVYPLDITKKGILLGKRPIARSFGR